MPFHRVLKSLSNLGDGLLRRFLPLPSSAGVLENVELLLLIDLSSVSLDGALDNLLFRGMETASERTDTAHHRLINPSRQYFIRWAPPLYT